MTSILPTSTPLITVLTWVVALLVDPGPLSQVSVLLIGTSLLVSTTVGVIGIVLAGARWARRVAVAGVAATLVVAALRPIDPWWVGGLGASTVALAVLLSPLVGRHLRRLPPVSGPPARAVALPVALLFFPFVLGLASWDGTAWATLVVGLSAPLAALWYARVLPGGLYMVRWVWPALAMGLALPQSLPAGAVSFAGGILLLALAWHGSVKVAFHPPRESGTAYAIPPELTPREILDAAGLDDRGRPG